MEPPPPTTTARVLRTLEIVQSRPGVGAADIARRLEVSDRAVRRYVGILREAGVPIESTRGRHGGYRMGRSLQPPPLVFTASEALGLVMAVLDGHHAAADPTDPAGSALGKLIAALPPRTARHAEAVRAHAVAAPDRAAARPDATVTSDVIDAVALARRTRLHYTTATGKRLEQRVDPWAVVVRHGRWYLLCHSHESNAARALRIDRIERVDVLNADADVPGDLDPVALLETHLAAGWDHEAVVEFDAPIDQVAQWIRPAMGRLAPLDGGSRCRLIGTTSNPAMYAGEWLARIPLPFHILASPELREAAAAIGRRMAAAADEV